MRPLKAVLDVGPIISAVIAPPGHSGQILLVWEAGAFELVTSSAILADLRRVLGYPHIRKRHQWSDTQIEAFIGFLAANATLTAGSHQVAAVQADPTDNKILACAEEGQADYIVASDERHLLPLGSFRGIPIVRPRRFLELLAKPSAETEAG
jgi:hypothetical protein